jgi:glutaredoxin 3
MAKEYLSQQGIPYRDFDVTRDREAFNEMVKISGARSVPVIAALDEVIIGFDKARLDPILGRLKEKKGQ